MTIQNIYDNDNFFASYQQLRNRQYNYNSLMEQPQLIAMLPRLINKRVLDIGCGAGGFASACLDQGAAKVVGLDVSKNMIELAKKTYHNQNLSFIQAAIEQYELEPQSYDLITSSLALHYVENFEAAIAKISSALAHQGTLLFSINHPITSANLADDDWLHDEQGNPQYLKVHRYHDEGERRVNWFVGEVTMYHRTLATIINTLIKHGLHIDEIAESAPTHEAIEKMPSLKKELERPCFLFIKASK